MKLTTLLLAAAAVLSPAALRAGEIEVRGNGLEIVSGDTTPRAADGTDFGTIPVGTTLTRTFVIHNTGSTQLTIFSVIENSAAFDIVSGAAFGIIPAGGSRDVEIKLDPTSAGTKTTTIGISSDDANEGTYTFDLTAEVTGDPEIVVRGKPITSAGALVAIADGDTTPAANDGTDFGPVDVGSSKLMTVEIENTGTAQLQISSVTSSSAQFIVSGAPATVGVGQSQQFTIAFNPTSRGVKNGTITINNNDGNEGTFTFSVTGTGRAADILVQGGTSLDVDIASGDTTPRPADGTDFGTVNTSTVVNKTFRIRNQGNDTLTVSSVSDDGAAFSISGAPGPTNPIAGGSFNDFTITLDPSSAGTKTAVVTILSNDPDTPGYTFTVTAEVLGNPEIVVRGKATAAAGAPVNITDGDTAPATNDGTDFGTVDVGSAGSMTVEIENTGDAQLQISSVTSSSNQFVVSGAPATVGVGQTQQFVIGFTPASRGVKNATITINNNDANENPFTFSVTGTGRAPDVVVEGGGSIWYEIPNGDTSPLAGDGTDFGSVVAGSAPVAHTFRVRNQGNNTLTVSAIMQDGAAFSLSGTPGPANPIPAGANDEFTITFDPVSAGVKTATVTVLSNDPDTPGYTLRITGTATGTPEIVVRGQVSPISAWVNIVDGDTTPGDALDGTGYASQSVNGSGESHQFQIENTGNAQLTIDSIFENSPHFTVTGIPATVGVGQTQNFTVTCNPAQYGTHTTVITIRNNDTNEAAFTFTVGGAATGSDITVKGGTSFAEIIASGDDTPDTADDTDFGLADVTSASVTHSFRVKNNGNSGLLILGTSVTGAAWSVGNLRNTALPVVPGDFHDFTVTFDPTTTGPKSGTVTILTNDTDTPAYTFDVAGFGSTSQPAIRVLGDDGTVLTDGQVTISMADGTGFGNVDVTGGSARHEFIIESVGLANLHVTSITSSVPGFTISNAPATALRPGASAAFLVTFDPVAAGDVTATITVNSDNAADGTFTFSVRGSGVNSGGVSAPEIAVFGGLLPIANGDTSPSLLDGTDFGRVEAGQTRTRTFRIWNVGTAPLTISAAGIPLLPAATDGVAPVIPAGTFDDFTVTVAPIAAGVITVNFIILNNDTNEGTYAFRMTAEGIAPTGSVAITGLQPSGSDMQLTFTSIPGRNYRIAGSNDLLTWTAEPGLTGLPGDSTAQTYTIPAAVGSRPRFWRIEQE